MKKKTRIGHKKKGAIVRKLRGMPPSAVLLFEDEIILRLFPVLRRAWSLSGEQAAVAITGRNAQQVLFGAINLRTGHRLLMDYAKMNQEGFQAFLYRLHCAYRGRPVWLLLDRGTLHTAPKSQAVAAVLHVKLIWLPKQCPELNAMDHFWKEVKADIAANYQHASIEQHALVATAYALKLSNKKALQRAGILSKNFWLKSFFK